MQQSIKHLDVSLLEMIRSCHTPLLDNVFLFITSLGNPSVLIPLCVIVTGYLAYSKKFDSLRFFMLGVGGAALLNLILKAAFRRDRPALWQTLITETNFSFPSGHAMASSAFIFCVIAMLWNTRWRLPSIIIGGFLLLLIGLSRLYLGVHYPSDVIAGWLGGDLWVLLVFVVLSRAYGRHNTSLSPSYKK